jgi:hypothetical protein
MTNKTEARHAAVKALHDIMQAVPSSSLYSLAEAVLDAGYAKHGKDSVLIEGMYFSHAEILRWREDSCTPGITIEAVGVTREGDDGLYIEWTLEGGIAALETAGLVLFACPEANDMCDEDGSCEVYLAPVDLDATEQRGFIRGMNAESEDRDARATSTMACDVPPPGWTCSRAKGHDGPCAASQTPKGSGSIEFDALLAEYHEAVWEAAAYEESNRTDYDLAGVDIAKKIQAMFRAQVGEQASPAQTFEPEQLRAELDSYVAGLQAERRRLLALLKKIDKTPLDRWYHEHLNSDITEAVRFLERSPQQLTYFSSQSTGCAGCGIHKHTPLRVDPMGGYVCLTCIDKELDRLLIEESAREAEGDWPGCQEISDLPRVHEVMSNFSTDPTEDNGIAVVQAIVQATTRKTSE